MLVIKNQSKNTKNLSYKYYLKTTVPKNKLLQNWSNNKFFFILLLFRHLKPYIFRDSVTKPLWMQMLKELKERFRQKNGLPECTEVETIDYSYVRAKHIQSVNALARQFFWPGIDCKSLLDYYKLFIVIT